MKIKKLLLSISMLCLAILVMVGATVPAMQFGAQAMTVRATNEYLSALDPKELFDSKGNYTVDMDYLKTSLLDGQVFNFFGYDWRLVFINEKQNVATFLMADPFTGSIFNYVDKSGSRVDVNGNGDTNIWSNGYAGTVFAGDNGDAQIKQSKIRELLIEEASNIIDQKSYSKYKDKVVAGYVDGTNESVTEHKIGQLSFSRDYYGHYALEEEVTNKLTAQYGLSDADRLWLPSIDELTQKWNVHQNILQWTDTTNNSGRAWLRTPDFSRSDKALCVSYTKVGNTGTINDYFVSDSVAKNFGVRPAIHLDITDLTAVEGNNGGWFNEDWLKTLFIVVCILGITGIGLVITAVVLKSRQKKAK